MLDERTAARLMTEELGIEVNPDYVVKLPDDGTPGHLGSGHWDVYAARCGEFTALLYYYDEDQHYTVNLV